MPLPLPLPSVEDILRCVSYDPTTGIFWLVNRKRSRKANNDGQAGTKASNGYFYIYINGRRWLAHRLAWKIQTGFDPEFEIDHKNTKRDDNRWSNLRNADKDQQARNTSIRKNNKSGYKGVSFNTKNKSFVAKIYVNKRQIHLGYYSNAIQAHIAYYTAAKKNFGEFANNGNQAGIG